MLKKKKKNEVPMLAMLDLSIEKATFWLLRRKSCQSDTLDVDTLNLFTNKSYLLLIVTD